MRRIVLTVLALASCGSPPAPTNAPPASSSAPNVRAADKPAVTGYSGHGAESVPPEVLARFAPTPIPAELSRRIQALLDVRAPVGVLAAPDGKSLYFAWNVTGTYQVWKADGPRRFPVQLTGGEDVSRVAGLSPDGKKLLVSKDRKGEENPGLYVLDTDRGVALTTIQHLPKVQTQLQWISDDSRWVYYRANDKKPDAYAIYKYDLAAGRSELVFGEDGLWSVEDVRGKKLLLSKATGALTSEKWEWDEAQKKLVPLFGQDEKEEYHALYAPAAGEVLVSTSKFGEFRRVYRAKPKGGPLAEADTTALTPEMKMDVESFFLDRAKKTLYFMTNDRGYTRAYARDARTNAEKKLPRLDADHVTVASATPDGRWAVVRASGARMPTTSYVLDWQTGQLVQWLVPSTPEIDVASFAEPKLEEYTARDGTKIPMFVRRPATCAERPCPVIVHFHGGPESQTRPIMSTYGQIFAEAGYVWVEPNVRGSDGYGKTWLHADDGPKRLSIITDIEDAAKHVRVAFAHEGKAPKVGVFGGSYGGYSTLLAMTKFAGAYDAGVSVVGMSNLVTFLKNTAPYRRMLRAAEYGDLEKDEKTLLELSPITHIDKLSAPLLLIQGATDPRVPVGEAIQMFEAIQRRGLPTKLVIFPDEGHGTQKRENKVLEIGHTLAFFDEHLKGKK